MKIRRIIYSAVGLLIVGMVPFPSVITPNTTIRVVDDLNGPVSGVPVFRTWYAGAEIQSGNDRKSTDKTGSATFNEQKAWANILMRVLSPRRHLTTNLVRERTVFEIYCPSGFEPSLAEPEYTPVQRHVDRVLYRTRRGDDFLVDFRQAEKPGKFRYSSRILFDYKRTAEMDLTLTLRKVTQHNDTLPKR